LHHALKHRPKSARLLALLRDHLIAQERWPEAITAQERLVGCCSPVDQHEARLRLAHMGCELGRRHRAGGRLAEAKAAARKALREESDLEPALLLLGDLALDEGDMDAAIRQWGRAGTPAAQQRVERLLAEDPQRLSARELLERFPTRGMLVTIAKLYLHQGDPRRARNALRKALSELGSAQGATLPALLALLGEASAAAGDTDRANSLYRDAVRKLLGGDDGDELLIDGPRTTE
jgi:tetratricopeptide (TPR) repeat protein